MATKIGDVFVVKIENEYKKYFQYIANDLTQLNSDVIRAFSKKYSISESPSPSEIIDDQVEFYAHVVIKWGIKLNLWEKVGNTLEVGKCDVLFRDTKDYGAKVGERRVEVSNKWRVWKINKDFNYVGTLNGSNLNAEIGVVVAPHDIFNRISTGEYDFIYPKYEGEI